MTLNLPYMLLPAIIYWISITLWCYAFKNSRCNNILCREKFLLITKGDQPYGDSSPVLTPNSDYETKQIGGTEVKLRNNYNGNLPAAKFTIPENGLECIVFSTVQESEVEKVAESILQAYSKL